MEIYGGLFFENLVARDKYFELQVDLFRKDLIQGIQIRVAHPVYASVELEELSRIFAVLPDGLRLFFHFGAENVGVDLGERFDECGVFARHSNKMDWPAWNRGTIQWGIRVALWVRSYISAKFPFGNLHPGYGLTAEDDIARRRVIESLQALDKWGEDISIENVPPFAIADDVKGKFWGFGGTPDDMAALLAATSCSFLINFSHILVMVNQAKAGLLDQKWKDLKYAVQGFLELPHMSICHFSGSPPGLTDEHEFFSMQEIHPVVLEALAGMEAVCLEIPYDQKAEEKIKKFKALFKKF